MTTDLVTPGAAGYRARYTSAIPPAPRRSSNSYRPNCVCPGLPMSGETTIPEFIVRRRPSRGLSWHDTERSQRLACFRKASRSMGTRACDSGLGGRVGPHGGLHLLAQGTDALAGLEALVLGELAAGRVTLGLQLLAKLAGLRLELVRLRLREAALGNGAVQAVLHPGQLPLSPHALVAMPTTVVALLALGRGRGGVLGEHGDSEQQRSSDHGTQQETLTHGGTLQSVELDASGTPARVLVARKNPARRRRLNPRRRPQVEAGPLLYRLPALRAVIEPACSGRAGLHRAGGDEAVEVLGELVARDVPVLEKAGQEKARIQLPTQLVLERVPHAEGLALVGVPTALGVRKAGEVRVRHLVLELHHPLLLQVRVE